ncbi:MAG: flagellar biosynthetic protein FliO [Sedimentisphaerales bacterium]|nr:flagellar biosynthetic protein FliO [Sedimentisphaerales bacterium]
MPLIARIVGLVLIGISPAALLAQTIPPGEASPTDDRSTETRRASSTSARRPIVAPPPFARPAFQPGPDTSVVPAAYQASSVDQSHALGGDVGGAPASSPVGERSGATKGDDAMPLSPPNHRAGLRLPARGEKSETTSGRGGLEMLVTTGGALALVVGLILVLAWAVRRAAPRGSLPLPTDVVEVLGRAPLGHRQQVSLLRCGNKLLLVSVTSDGAETLTEITDPAEVDRLAGLCQQARPGSATAAFRNVLQQFGREPDDSRFGEEDTTDVLGRRSDRRHRAWEGSDV